MNRSIKLSFTLLLLTWMGTPAIAQDFRTNNSLSLASDLEDVNGVSFADYDKDGDLDIYIVAVRRFQEGDSKSWSRLIRNDLEGGFVDVTEESNLLVNNETVKKGAMGDRFSASWGDYDNDGYPDLFLANNGGDELWRNLGNGQFEDVTESSGVQGCMDCYSSNGLWWDYDLDGDLDLYVSDWLKDNRQFENNGDGTFTDVSSETRLDDYSRTWSALPLDVNKDRWPDLYVVNDFGDNRLFVNDGTGNFTDETKEYGLEDDGEGMGVDICDYNNDGFFDIYLTNIFDREPNPFFVGNPDGTFSDKARQLGVDDTGWGWASRFFDADHDMDEDLYVVNGMFVTGGRDNRNVYFDNREGEFIKMGESLGIDNIEQARGMDVFDFDLDGDLDILIANRRAPVFLHENRHMQNEEGINKNWLQIILKGTESNRDAYGSIVSISCEGKDYQRMHTGANIFGQSLKPVHFGLAENELVDEIIVTWPDASRELFQGVKSNQIVELVEGQGVALPDLILGVKPELPRVRIYPNPFENEIWIDGLSGSSQLRINDLTGKEILTIDLEPSNQNVQFIDLSNLLSKPGTYFYELESTKILQKGTLLKIE